MNDHERNLPKGNSSIHEDLLGIYPQPLEAKLRRNHLSASSYGDVGGVDLSGKGGGTLLTAWRVVRRKGEWKGRRERRRRKDALG